MPAIAFAEPVGEDDAPPSTPAEHTASDVEGAPLPGDESGWTEAEQGDSTARRIGRGVLFVPKLALEGAFAPVRVGLWAYDRYQLKARVLRLFFNDAGTIGLYPVAQLESQYGVNVGARFVHLDLAGEGERLGLHAGTGGRFRQIASAKLRSGNRFGRDLAFQLEGEFERRPRDAFYGIGNANTGAVVVPASGEAVEARFREQRMRVSLLGDIRIASDLHVRASGALADFELGRSDDGLPIDELYPLDVMVGFGGVRHGYGELELRWDSRRAATTWESRSVRSTGWLLGGFAGRATALDEGADYYRYGVDLQRFVRLGRGRGCCPGASTPRP